MSPVEYKLHRERSNGYHRKFRMKNPECDKDYRKRNPEIIKKIVAKYQDKYYHILKKNAMDSYGGRCVHIDGKGKQCVRDSENGLSDLTIDHSWGDGYEHRQEIFGDPYKAGWHFYLWLRNNDFPQDLGLQVLCKDHHSKPRKRGKFDDPIWLKKRYVNEGLSLSEIARQCNCSYKTIKRRIEESGISRW